ncbi:spore cortex biosynthesis protein YabQ [Anaerobranca californiensis DSM 14826]|jgi:spore cortex biosynthesis protein YabQ|uniref:Spore cortex biosynthesis protein YabQ n=1 Tax=Anaerobranca californiensis DSM 14826 TaxID=1120989 RepID=A0A1M6PHV1_9FIRM|nr:spore cortex biosynthesis protein YabQ [Anaerobranca californiensis]SHK07519.1 spore cortex biosynthesis protein YabQ [Anaerobranca californiensis DSM 14826]
MSVWFQTYVLGVMLFWGVILGIIFDIYRFLVPTQKVKGIVQYILDFLFWIVVIVTTFVVLIFANYGEVRLYLIMGMTLGFILYFKTLSKLVIKILTFIRTTIIKIYKFIYKLLLILLSPIIWITSRLFSLIYRLKNFFIKSKE